MADGSRIVVDSICKDLRFTIQNHKFSNDLRLFPLGGSDLIMGVDWLKQFNPITLDYVYFKITLLRDELPITLQGDTNEGTLHTITGKQMGKLLQKSRGTTQGYICMMMATPQHTNKSQATPIPSQLKALLSSYNSVFTEPKGLPPIRPQDH